MRSICFILAGLLLTVTGCDNGGKPAAEGKPQAEKATPDFDEEMLWEAGVGTDNASLLAFLRKRSASDADLLGMERLVRQLGSEDFDTRQEASKKLVDLGLIALPPLRQAVKDTDQEIARRAKECVDAIVRDSEINLPLGAVRLLVRRNPPGAVEVLLRYLPFVVDEDVEEEIWYGLDAIGVREAKAHPAFSAALTDAFPARRAVAACILARVGTAEQRTVVRKLLSDKEPIVRLRAAQGFVAAQQKDRAAIPVLIGLLKEPSVHLSWQAEELLYWVAAGEQPPIFTLGEATDQTRRVCHDAWQEWWAERGPKLDLDRPVSERREPGLFFLCLDSRFSDSRENNGCVALYGSDGRCRWELKGLKYPGEVRLLPGNRILVAERHRSGTGPETEYDLLGKALGTGNQTSQVPIPLERGLWHSRVTSKPVSYSRKLPTGHIVHLSFSSEETEVVVRNPKMGTETKLSVSVPDKIGTECEVDYLHNGHVLLLDQEADRLSVFNAAGKKVWQRKVPGVTAAVGLRAGSLLVSQCKMETRVFEVGQEGKTIWHFFPKDLPRRIRPTLNLVAVGFARHSTRVDLDSVPYQIMALEHQDFVTRRWAAEALRDYIPAAKPEVSALAKAMFTDADEQVRGLCTDALLRAGPVIILARSEILAAANSPEASKRAHAIRMLGNIHLRDARTLAVILKAFTDQEPEVRRQAVITTGLIGPGAASAIPQLLQILRGNDFKLRFHAARALGGIGPVDRTVIPALIEALQDKDQAGTRAVAAQALGNCGSEARAAVPIIVEMLKAQDQREHGVVVHERQIFLMALAQIGATAEPAVPILIDILKDKTSLARHLHCYAARALGEIGQAAKESLPVLKDALHDSDPNLRIVAEQALNKIEGKKD